MIIPYPDSDLSQSLIAHGAEIILLLRKSNEGAVFVEKIMKKYLALNNKYTPDQFINAISMLFAVGLIEYSNYKIKLKENDNPQTTLFDYITF